MVRHLLFDLDDTLWDCAGNSVISLRRLFDRHQLGNYFKTFEYFNERYQAINHMLWAGLPDNGLTVPEVRVKRFIMTLSEAGMQDTSFGEKLNDDYLTLMINCPATMPYATEVLDKLSTKYQIEIVTNGMALTQRGKLKASGLDKYVKHLFPSAEMGEMKPKPGYFEKVLATLGCGKDECIVIGDNPQTDIQGAQNFGIEAIWYNWQKADADICPNTRTISDLRELIEILM